MQFVPSTALALIVVLALLVKGPFRGSWLFLAVAPLGAAAAFNLPAVGGASILIVDLAAMVMFAMVLTSSGGIERLGGTMRPGSPGLALFYLAVFSIIATLLFPTLFRGMTEVFSISRADNENGIVSLPLKPNTGNLTQLFRMMLGVITYFSLATVFRLRPDAVTARNALLVCSAIQVGLGWADVTLDAIGLETLLEPLRSANYSILSEVRMVGLKRMIGGFPEASSFGYFTLGLFAFWLQYWLLTPNSRLAQIMAILTGIALLRSTSSASYVALAMFLLTLGLIGLAGRLRSTVSRRSAAIFLSALLMSWIVAMAIFAAYEYIELVTQFLDRLLFTKLDSASGQERGSWNAQAFRNFLDTYMMGTGLGSVRASSWLMATLASLGVIGTAIFFTFLYRLARLPEPITRGDPSSQERAVIIRSLKTGCLAYFLSSLLTSATPDPNLIFFVFAGLAAGLSRGAVLDFRESQRR